ncbi:hypothetical protein [Dietzia sp. ANT_WB102]|uniref:hypothetical protein n=1 Tax=Dietzia sp. ANT_WB102 TaxID=2597345 RepID=UPI0011F037AB|nr:hypothetical protein [Dietzia sp. ANT_WB102]KAA0918459.1 hypothetical protein FQ137_03675 [Dietzia sp. ANT_WB102]
MAKKKTWNDLTTAQRAGLLALISLQASLAASAWADLAAQPASKVQGSKGKWAAIIAINFIGPILYFTRGRRP